MLCSITRIRFAAHACALVLGATVAPAQAQPPAVADCHAIDSDAERLACYDRVTGRTADTPVPAASASPAPAAAAQPAAATQASTAPSYLSHAWGLERDAPRVGLSFFHANYLLLARHSDAPNDYPFSPIFAAANAADQSLDNLESKFQISGKLRVWASDDRRWSLYGAYTQQSQWQVYNEEISRPFRETNYMPEVFGTYAPRDWSWAGFDLRLINAGFTHQSNGRADPLSRSWDRLFVEAGVERGDLAFFARAWYRIPESKRDDDNPDITDYYGYGQINGIYRLGEHTFEGMLRGNVSKGNGALQLGWFSPELFGPIRGYVQFFTGYGESMIDYNWNQTTIGAGIALKDGP
jgi:phospholipase A1